VTLERSFDRRDIDLLHLHHRVEGSLGGSAIRTGVRIDQSNRRNLPVQAPLVLAPAAHAFFAAVADDCIPVAIGLGLIRCCDLKRERPGVLHRRPAIEAEAWNAHDRELDRQDGPFLPRGIVARCQMNCTDRRIGKRPRIELRGLDGIVVVPQADTVPGRPVVRHCLSLFRDWVGSYRVVRVRTRDRRKSRGLLGGSGMLGQTGLPIDGLHRDWKLR